jgi:hypothetical protein
MFEDESPKFGVSFAISKRSQLKVAFVLWEVQA